MGEGSKVGRGLTLWARVDQMFDWRSWRGLMVLTYTLHAFPIMG